MRRPINWITISISLLFLVLGLSLRDKPSVAAAAVAPASTPPALLAFPVIRREPLKFERISLDSPAVDGDDEIAPRLASPDRVAGISPALISFETVWYVSEPQALRTPELRKAF